MHPNPNPVAAACLSATPTITSDHPRVVAFARAHARGHCVRDRAVSLYLAVRDQVRCDPCRIGPGDRGMVASTVWAQGFGWCVPKAVLMATVARGTGGR